MAENRVYSLCFAQLQRDDSLFSEWATLKESLEVSWQPENTITRYRREWHVSPITLVAADMWAGELGYVTAGELSTLDWDDDERRFVRGTAPSGRISPFVVDLNTGTCCFQLRPGFIRATTFTVALQEILNLRGGVRWTILPLVKSQDFPEWRRDVDRITRFQFKMNRPNPNYEGRPDVKELIERLHAEAVTLRAKALTGESLDTNAPIFRQALDHVQRNYGEAKVTAEDAEGGQSEWHSSGGGVSPEIEKIQANGEPEISPNFLVDLLRLGRPDARPQYLDPDSP